MPRYAGISSITSRLGALDVGIFSNREDDPSRFNAVHAAIRDAESLVDSYVGVRYRLPLAGIVEVDEPEKPSDPLFPHVLTRCVVHITIFLLAKDAHKMSKVIKGYHDDCISWLIDLKKGDVTLGSADDTNRVPVAELIGPERIFTRDLTAGC